MTRQRRWTFLVYMAGDNGKVFDALGGKALMAPMELAGYDDIAEMEAVGSTEDVAILVQFDTLADAGCSYRLFIGPAGSLRRMEEVAEQNTGDPASLRDFVLWGAEHYPAEHYAVVLWNHGTGWKEDDLYAFARSRGLSVAAPPDEVRSLGRGARLSRALFRSTAAAVLRHPDPETRAIAYDDSSLDFLDNVELRKALREVAARLGRPISLVGMDACLMSMLEVAYQLRGEAACLVGSEEIEPLAGWPYEPILRALTERPDQAPRHLAECVVREYAACHGGAGRGGPGHVTQAALDLSAVGGLADAVARLGRELRLALEGEDLRAEVALSRARHRALRFHDADYLDLHDFLTIFCDEYDGAAGQLADAATAARGRLAPGAVPPVVLANAADGRVARAGGVSLYLPDHGCSPFYDRLDWAASGWGDFIRYLNRVERSNP
jgi:hypothetical protein